VLDEAVGREAPVTGVSAPIAATVDVGRAAERHWDALVVGAGPAGAMSALLLARDGLSTLLVDRQVFPRHKVCGCCVNDRAVAQLERAGVAAELRALGGRSLRTIRLLHERRAVDLPLPGGLAVSRAALDGLLVRAAIAAGADFLPGTAASLPVRGASSVRGEPSAREDRRCVSLLHRQGGRAHSFASVVIAADGLGSSSLPDEPGFRSRVSPAARIGVGGLADRPVVAAEPGTITMAIGQPGYVGVVDVEQGGTIVAAALDAAHTRDSGGAAAAVTAILAEAGARVDVAALRRVDWTGTVALTRRLLRPVGERIIVLGDAAGYVEPFTGEGIAWALSSAEEVVPFVRRGLSEWSASLENDWLATRRARIENRQRWCRTLAYVLRHPPAVRTAIAALQLRPGLARPVLAHVVGRANGRG
jgi:flavin-dependent dehydrogenase